MKNTPEIKTFFTDSIPSGILSKEPFNAKKISAEQKDKILNRMKKESSNSKQDFVKIANIDSNVRNLLKEEESIKGIRESNGNSVLEILENNKSKTFSSVSKGTNLFSKAHIDTELSNKGYKGAVESILADSKSNYILKSMKTKDAEITEQSRQALRSDRQDKLASSKKEYDESNKTTRRDDIDPITKIRKGSFNISEKPIEKNNTISFVTPPRIRTVSEQEIEKRANTIASAAQILQEHNKKNIDELMHGHKHDWSLDAVTKLTNKISNSITNIREKQAKQSEDNKKISIDDETLNSILKDRFSSSKKGFNVLSDQIKEYNNNRSQSIKTVKNIKTTLDEPSLPVHSSAAKSLKKRIK